MTLLLLLCCFPNRLYISSTICSIDGLADLVDPFSVADFDASTYDQTLDTVADVVHCLKLIHEPARHLETGMHVFFKDEWYGRAKALAHRGEGNHG